MSTDKKPYAFVDCIGSPEEDIKSCGTQPLTEEQYQRQLSNPNATWRCPCCYGDAWFNDELSEKAMGITSDEALEDWPAPIGI